MEGNDSNQLKSGEPQEIESTLLKDLEKNSKIENSEDWASSHGWKHDDALVGVIKRLEGHLLIETKMNERKKNTLTKEGEEIVKVGSPEARTYEAIPEEGIEKAALDSKLGPVAKIGFSQAMRLKWVALDKSTGKVNRVVASIDDATRKQLGQIHNSPDSVAEQIITPLRKRKLVASSVVKTFELRKGPEFSLELKKAPADLTSEMLQSGDWKNTKFKEYNFNALGAPIISGYQHPLLKVRHEFREIFLGMGFEEMPTNNFVESSFWNFDALFQPQQHPARDAHDTFFLSEPAEASYFPQDYLERVKEMHVNGGHDSIGWRYDWKLEETKKNILRTHTTAVSSRMLYKLAQDGFQPKKYFSIDRVFRNEEPDATHLAEFHQVEGLVADYDLTLGNLMGVIKQFFARLGMTKLRFKPAYNPYTEPSMEIFSYHEGLGKWMEVGNSGMFRPEMLLPMGLPPNVRVLGWGLSLERPTMIKYGVNNIRDLVGSKVSLDFIKENPIVRLDK